MVCIHLQIVMVQMEESTKMGMVFITENLLTAFELSHLNFLTLMSFSSDVTLNVAQIFQTIFKRNAHVPDVCK